MPSLDLRPSLTHQNLRRLCALRYAAVVGGAAVAVAAHRFFHFDIALAPVMWLLGAVAAANTAILLRASRPAPMGEWESLGYLIFDVAALTGVLYLTGGSTNPFVMMYLVPLVLTVVSLPTRFAWIMGVLVVLCYSGLMMHYVPLTTGAHEHERDFSLHIGGMWFDFMLSAALIAWFGTRMAETVRQRDAQLAALREAELRKERVVALGTLAAGTAHELGTPLATLSIIAGELEADAPLPAPTVQLLREQIARCKDILNSMAASAGSLRAQGGGKTALDDFLRNVVTQWQKGRPQVNHVSSFYAGSSPAPQIISEQTLALAIANLLNNAADASHDDVEIECRWTADELVVEVSDRGPGLAPELAQHAGDGIATSSKGGLGLGLFLTFATVERLGGNIQLYEREGGGMVCRLTLPLAALELK